MLASSDIHSTPEQISLSDHELNSLRILLITRILGHPDDSCTISSLCPLFIPISITPHSAPKTKAKLVHIADWFFQVLSNREHGNGIYIYIYIYIYCRPPSDNPFTKPFSSPT